MVGTSREYRFRFVFLARFYLFFRKRLFFKKVTDDIFKFFSLELWVVRHDSISGLELDEGDGRATIPQPLEHESSALPT